MERLTLTHMAPVVAETERHFSALGNSSVRLSLMSVSSSSMTVAALSSAVCSAAAPADIVGILVDGSIGILSLRALGTDGGKGVEDRFLARLKLVLSAICFGREMGPLCFRAVHRWATELSEPGDLVDTLMDSRPTMVMLPLSRKANGAPFARPAEALRHSA
jgi:hypothetical protein